MKRLFAWSIAVSMYVLKLTCRHRIFNDQRAEIRGKGEGYLYAQLHAHQIAAGMYGEPGTVAMVSRSGDGDMIVPMLRIFGKKIVRGSSGKANKGGASALQQMIRLVREGEVGVIAVDGPRGPRGSVQKGIAMAAKKSGMPVVPVICLPSRRFILSKAWDRLQIPQPFSRISFYFGEPMYVDDTTDLNEFTIELGHVLHDLEAMHDPAERSPRFVTSDAFEEFGRAA